MYGRYGGAVLNATIATGATRSTWVNVTGWNHVSIKVPAFGSLLATASAGITVYGDVTSAATAYVLRHPGVYSAGTGILNWEVPLSQGDYVVTCEPAAQMNFIKVGLTGANATATGGVSCEILAHN